MTRLRQAFENSAVSQAAIAERLGISKQLLTHWVRGRREPSTEQLGQLARVLGVDSTFLTGTMGQTSLPSSLGLDSLIDARWTFRPAPEDGGRDYGNANVLAFTPDIQTLVRELGQNGIDQLLRMIRSMHLRFALIELHRKSAAHAEFMRALQWSGLRPHIDAAIAQNSRLSSKLRRGLDGLDRLFLLRVDDYGTTGAYGDERTSDDRGVKSPFAALVRDNLNSSKESNIAGGTHGAGKGTAWQCSDLGTVLISSEVDPSYLREGQPEGALRFIAKTELTWHQWPDGAKAGPGWLAAPPEEGTRSLWIRRDELAPLFLDRALLPKGVDDSMTSGSSLMIVGFRDPQEDEDTDPAAVMERIAQAAAENFFPAMLQGRMRVSVEHHVDGALSKQDVVDPAKYVPEMVRAYRAYLEDEVVAPSEAAPGDTAHAQITHLIPATRPDASPTLEQFEDLDARCDLVVRFAKPEELGPPGANRRSLLNHVALVRGRLMVVEYLRRSNLVVGGRPFHGVLLAGEAVAEGRAQAAAEQFLRLSEPPAHNKWHWREDVRDNYRTGAKHCLMTEFYQRLTDTLRDLIKPEEELEENGPEELRKLLLLAGPNRSSALAVIRLLEKTLDGSVWRIKGEIAVNDRKRPLLVSPRLAVLPESGAPVELSWQSLKLLRATRGAPVVTDDLEIRVPVGTTRFLFEASSNPPSDRLDLTRCKVTVRVGARVVPSDTIVASSAASSGSEQGEA